MKIHSFKSQFTEQLKEEYPAQEIHSFFYLLMEFFLGKTRLDIALNPDIQLSNIELKKFENAICRLKSHEPIQYITGETSFFGLKFRVNKHVLIPRPETEELVQWILEELKNSDMEDLKILDIGTGSGCIAISLAKNLPKAKVSAIDISEKALETAKTNAHLNNTKINLIASDILKAESLPGKYDIIISNPPYVQEREKKEMQRNVLEHEPALALYVKDENPLLFYRKITTLARRGLNEKGKLYFEVNQYLGEETALLLTDAGFKAELRKDLFGNYRMLKGEFYSPFLN